MSVRLSTARPRACSGDIYAAVPRIMPIPVIAGLVSVGDWDEASDRTAPPPGSASLASPKSSTFTVPSSRTLMLAGFRSRWTMPRSCAASSAPAICFAIGSASSMGIGPCAMRSASVGPSISSMTSAFTPGSPGASRRRVLEPEDRRDVRMIERGEDFRFALKAREPIGVGCQRRWQDLHGDPALQARVRRAIDLTHSAGTERRQDLVGAQPGASRYRHLEPDSSGRSDSGATLGVSGRES